MIFHQLNKTSILSIFISHSAEWDFLSHYQTIVLISFTI